MTKATRPRLVGLLCVVAGVTLSWLPHHRAQNLEGILRGRVYDKTKALIRGVTITVMNTRTGESRSTKTDEVGQFTLTGLPGPGSRFELRAEVLGFWPDIRVTRIPPTSEMIVDFTLDVEGTHGYGDVYVIDEERHRVIPDGPKYRGQIRGRSLDEQGSPLAGVRIVAHNLEVGTTFTGKSVKGGSYDLQGLTKGFYKVCAETKAYWPECRSAKIEYAVNPEIEFRLEVRAGD
jgi:hypothetical protein